MNIGDSLVFLRTKNKLTQETLAQTINIARSTLSNYERNNRMPDIQTLSKLADHFNVTLDFLVGQTSPFPNTMDNMIEPDKKNVLQYYDRLSEEDKDYIKGLMIQLYKKKTRKKTI